MTIRSRFHDYEVSFYKGVSEILGERFSPSNPEFKNCFFLIDSNVARLYEEPLRDIMRASSSVFLVEANEVQKSYQGLTPIFQWLLEHEIRKNSTLVVMGGGIPQDMGCFIASVLFRGLRWELIPTTLLAQCDSCIGSKSSINFLNYKNQIGTFYPPHKVHISPEFLSTLSSGEIRSGLGEAVKLSLLTSEAEVRSFQERLTSLVPFLSSPFSPSGSGPIAGSSSNLSSNSRSTPGSHSPFPTEGFLGLVRTCLEIKQTYIEKDEMDRGCRNLLNYGHTFGHAYESATNYALPHGIGVIFGMMTAMWISEKRGYLPQGLTKEMKKNLFDILLGPTTEILLRAQPEKIWKALKTDKKNTSHLINCILTKGPGQMFKEGLELESQLRPWIQDFFLFLEEEIRGAKGEMRRDLWGN